MDPQEFLDLARHLFPGQRELWGVSLVGRVHVGAVGGAVDENGRGRIAIKRKCESRDTETKPRRRKKLKDARSLPASLEEMISRKMQWGK